MIESGENTEDANTSEGVADDLFLKVFRSSPDSISVSRMSDGVFLDVNEGFERISGYSRDEVIGRSSLGFAFWADGPQHRDAFIHEVKTKGSVRDFEGRWLTRTNEIRDCLVSGEMIDYQNEKCLVLVITDITERLRAQKQLERSERMYRSIVADQTDFIVRWLPGGIRTYVNDAYCTYFGVTRDELIGTSFYDLIPQEWHDRVRGKLEPMTPEQPVATSQHQVIRADGSEGWNEWTVRAIFDDAGRILEYQSVGRDITGSKRTLLALRQSEALLRKIIDNSPNSIFLRDRDGRFIMVNRAMAERNATTSGEMIGRTDTEFAANWLKTPADIKKYRASERKIVDGNEIAFIPAHKYTPMDGTTRWFQTTKIPFSMASGKRCLLGVSVDVTEYKRAEETRRQAEEQYRSTFESVANGLTVRDTDGNVVAVNPAMCQLYGYTREEYLNLTLRDLMPPEMYPAIKEFRETVGSGKTFAMEAKGLHKSGRLMDLEIRVSPFQYRGQPHTLTIAWDITERKRAEDALRLTQTAIDVARDAILRVREDASIGYANDEACRATGYTREELLSMTVFDIDTEYPRQEYSILWNQLQKTKSLLFEKTWTTKSGHLIPMEIRINHLEFSGREYVFVFARDVAERKEAESALRRTQTAVDDARDAIFWVRSDGKFGYVNDAACDMTEYTRDELKTMGVPDIDPAFPSSVFSTFFKALRETKSQLIETTIVGKSGRAVPVEILATYMEFLGQEYLYAFARDITDRKRAESQLVKLNEQLLVEREALDQKNIALGEVLNHMEQDREKYKHEICESVEKLILPTVSKLARKGGHLGLTEVAVLQNALEAIIQKDIDTFTSNMNRLSARELDICDQIKDGCSSKEIAERLNISVQTVHTHRHAIRRKLQLKNKGVNLAAYLRAR